MRSRRLLRRVVLTGLIVLGALLNTDQSDADGVDDSGTFLVNVFGCYMPFPSDFVLQTGNPARITLSLRSKTEVTRIVISDYKETLDESFVRTGFRTVGQLLVEDFSVSNQFRKVVDVVRIHDGKQQMLIYAGIDGLVDSLVRGCQDLERGMLYE